MLDIGTYACGVDGCFRAVGAAEDLACLLDGAILTGVRTPQRESGRMQVDDVARPGAEAAESFGKFAQHFGGVAIDTIGAFFQSQVEDLGVVAGECAEAPSERFSQRPGSIAAGCGGRGTGPGSRVQCSDFACQPVSLLLGGFEFFARKYVADRAQEEVWAEVLFGDVVLGSVAHHVFAARLVMLGRYDDDRQAWEVASEVVEKSCRIAGGARDLQDGKVDTACVELSSSFVQSVDPNHLEAIGRVFQVCGESGCVRFAAESDENRLFVVNDDDSRASLRERVCSGFQVRVDGTRRSRRAAPGPGITESLSPVELASHPTWLALKLRPGPAAL